MTAANLITCPKCGKSNPAGAKFCSGCRNPLASASRKAGPTPPPQRPQGLNNLMAGGGSAEVVVVAADANDVHAHVLQFFERRKGSQIQSQTPPVQVAAKAVFQHWFTTSGLKVLVDTDVQISAAGPGQSQVSVTTKTDGSSLGTIWGITGAFWLITILILGLNPFLLILAAIAAGSTYWLLQTEPGTVISKQLITELQKHAPSMGNTATEEPAPNPEPEQPAPQPEAAKESVTSGEDEIFERIAKLAKLRDSGAISAEEFDAKKAELMARI